MRARYRVMSTVLMGVLMYGGAWLSGLFSGQLKPQDLLLATEFHVWQPYSASLLLLAQSLGAAFLAYLLLIWWRVSRLSNRVGTYLDRETGIAFSHGTLAVLGVLSSLVILGATWVATPHPDIAEIEVTWKIVALVCVISLLWVAIDSVELSRKVLSDARKANIVFLRRVGLPDRTLAKRVVRRELWLAHSQHGDITLFLMTVLLLPVLSVVSDIRILEFIQNEWLLGQPASLLTLSFVLGIFFTLLTTIYAGISSILGRRANRP